mmetsp:Transcript_67463/g.144296  ORF Transcript_67463/g.144296 Transcript_67463/m.144296 type:complete len:307 (+) Transcript_67463:121-1041(+)
MGTARIYHAVPSMHHHGLADGLLAIGLDDSMLVGHTTGGQVAQGPTRYAHNDDITAMIIHYVADALDAPVTGELVLELPVAKNNIPKRRDALPLHQYILLVGLHGGEDLLHSARGGHLLLDLWAPDNKAPEHLASVPLQGCLLPVQSHRLDDELDAACCHNSLLAILGVGGEAAKETTTLHQARAAGELLLQGRACQIHTVGLSHCLAILLTACGNAPEQAATPPLHRFIILVLIEGPASMPQCLRLQDRFPAFGVVGSEVAEEATTTLLYNRVRQPLGHGMDDLVNPTALDDDIFAGGVIGCEAP